MPEVAATLDTRSSLRKGLKVLQVLAEDHGMGLRSSRIAELTGIPQRTVQDLLPELLAAEWIEVSSFAHKYSISAWVRDFMRTR